jgi:hypothetical protein
MSDWLIHYGSWCLAPFGLLGMYVVGLKKRWGWVLSMTTQVLWAFYAIGTGQFGFLIGTVSYFVVYLKNWLGWGRPDPQTDGPLCPNPRLCGHPLALHDTEGCTVTVPCDDPDFGPTMTCPCCERWTP